MRQTGLPSEIALIDIQPIETRFIGRALHYMCVFRNQLHFNFSGGGTSGAGNILNRSALFRTKGLSLFVFKFT